MWKCERIVGKCEEMRKCGGRSAPDIEIHFPRLRDRYPHI